MLAFGCAVVLVACAARPAAQFAASHPTASLQRIHVATEQRLDKLGPHFGEARPQGLNFFHVDVSVPEGHQTGQIEWPKGAPDAATDFVLTGSRVYDAPGNMVRAMRSGAKTTGRETWVYVHGFNVTFSEAAFRFAQIREDFGATEPGVLFSWLSAGDPRGYAYDRDSVLYSRDAFEKVLNELTVKSDGKVVILAHSMGTQLVMETLRQAAVRGNRGMLDRINAVAFISPDIDPGVFRSQVRAIGDLPQPFVVFVSHKDRALSLSSLLTGRKARLGVIDGPEEVEGLGVTVLDFTELGDGSGMDHSVPVTSPAAISVLRGMMGQAAIGARGFEDYVVLRKPQ